MKRFLLTLTLPLFVIFGGVSCNALGIYKTDPETGERVIDLNNLHRLLVYSAGRVQGAADMLRQDEPQVAEQMDGVAVKIAQLDQVVLRVRDGKGDMVDISTALSSVLTEADSLSNIFVSNPVLQRRIAEGVFVIQSVVDLIQMNAEGSVQTEPMLRYLT